MKTATTLILSLSFCLIPAGAQCLPPPSGLISWWPGDGDATDIQDGNDGTLVNGATFADGLVGQAFSLDGIDDHLFIGNPSNLKITGGLTLTAWINPDDLPELDPGLLNIGVIISKWGQGVNTDSYEMSILKIGGVIQLAGGIGVLGQADTTGLFGGEIQPGTWSHIAITYNAATGENIGYINGQPVDSRVRPGGINTSDLNVLIGREDSSKPRPFPGLIDELQIYNRALSAAEIEAIFNAGSEGQCKVIPVEIDIKPGSDPNSINCNNHNGVISVAILTTQDFDATTVDHTTVTFEGASERHVNKKSGEPKRHEEDVDDDGDTDLVLHFRPCDTVLDCSSTEGTLLGETFDGMAIEGADSVRMVGGNTVITVGQPIP